MKTLVTVTNHSPQIAIVTLNDPATLNCMSEEMADQFSLAAQQLAQSTPLRAIILTGAGKAFSAGGDLAMLEAKTTKAHEVNVREMLSFYDRFLALRSVPVPSIAVLPGLAIGAGVALALACDFRIAKKGIKLGLTFLKLGLHPGLGSSYFTEKLVGRAKATELLMVAETISSEEAERIGLINRAVDDPMANALTLAEKLTSVGPLALRQLTDTLREDPELERKLFHEAACQAENYASGEFKEGIAAIKEKRSAKF